MWSFIKIYGPPVYDAIKALEKLAINIKEVCIMDPLIANYFLVDEAGRGASSSSGSSKAMEYFTPLKGDISPDRCEKLVSKSGRRIGEYDFFFEWFSEPTLEELNSLIQKIDGMLSL